MIKKFNSFLDFQIELISSFNSFYQSWKKAFCADKEPLFSKELDKLLDPVFEKHKIVLNKELSSLTEKSQQTLDKWNTSFSEELRKVTVSAEQMLLVKMRKESDRFFQKEPKNTISFDVKDQIKEHASSGIRQFTNFYEALVYEYLIEIQKIYERNINAFVQERSFVLTEPSL